MLNIIFLSLYLALFHPLHVTFTDVVHNPDTKSVEITQKIFWDDLEVAMKNKYNKKLDIIKPQDPEQVAKLLQDYVLQNFQIMLDGKQQTITFLGHEVEEDAIWVYMEIPKVKNFNSIKVKNSLLFDLYTDQVNIINVSKQGKIKSLKLDPEEETQQLNF